MKGWEVVSGVATQRDAHCHPAAAPPTDVDNAPTAAPGGLTHRVHSASHSSMLCVVSTTERSSLTAAITSHIWRRANASMPE